MNNIIPMRKLAAETSKIAEICKETGEPIFVTKNGYGNMVVMSIDAYQKLCENGEIQKKLDTAAEQIERGEGRDGFEFLAEMRRKYVK